MKTASLLSLVAVTLVGCTTTTETTTTSTRTAATRDRAPLGDRASNKTEYTREDIEKTGREANPAEALETLDPAVYARGGGR